MTKNIKENVERHGLLVMILVALIFLCVDQRLSTKTSQKKQDQLFALMQNHYGHVLSEDLKKEGRRHAVAELIAESIDAKGDFKKLLLHGPKAIEAYVNLPVGSKEVVKGVKVFVMANSLYAFQHALKKTLPILEINKIMNEESNMAKEKKE